MTGSNRGRPSLGRFYDGLFDRAPWWLALLFGLAAVVVGVTVTFQPFDSLRALVALVAASLIIVGVGELTSARKARWIGIAWIAAGIAVAVWPGLTIRGLSILVGVALVVGGVVRLVAGIGGSDDHRVVAVLSGLARVVFGILALSWPDITVLTLSLLVGPALILFGVGQVLDAVLHRNERANRGRRPWPTWMRAVGATLSLVAALGLLAISSSINRSSADPDAFYAAPDSVPAKPGVLLRSEAFSRGIPDGARAWRILYTTTTTGGKPALASGLVVASKKAPAGSRPMIAWAHGTTGYAPKCAPSLLKAPFTAGAMPALDKVIANGWVLVATDYVGLGPDGSHPYLIGDPEARSVLDSIRATRMLKDVEVENRAVVWGHSQGGGAALWTGILAPSYAPDANVIGVAALSPATELPPIFDAVKDAPVGKIMGSYVLSAYAAAYPDVKVDDYVRPEARVLEQETAGRCLSGPEALVSVATSATTPPYFSKSPASGPLGKRLEENIPTGKIEAPLMIGQGLTDNLVLPTEQRRYVDDLCSNGQALEYRTYKGFDHVGVVLDPESALPDDLVTWTQERLDGAPAPQGCETVER